MESLLYVENKWDCEVTCTEVMVSCCFIAEEEVAAVIKGLKIGNADGHISIVSEMMKAAGVLVQSD